MQYYQLQTVSWGYQTGLECTKSTCVDFTFILLSHTLHLFRTRSESSGWADQFITSQLTHPILPLSPPLSSHSSLIHHDNWIRRRLGGQAAGEQGDGEGDIQSSWSYVAWEPASAASCSRRTQHPCQERTGQTHQPAADIHAGNEIIIHRQFDWLLVSIGLYIYQFIFNPLAQNTLESEFYGVKTVHIPL